MAVGSLMEPLRFDSSVLPIEDQFATYASGIANFDVSRSDTGPFAARALIWRIETLVFARLVADPACYTRSAERVRADRIDHFYVNFHYRGRAHVDCTPDGATGGPGSLMVLDMRRPCRMEVSAIDQISLAIPRQRLLDRLDGFELHGLVVRDGLAPLLGSTLRAVCATLSRLSLSQSATIERMLIDLVIDTLLDALRNAAARTAREEELASRVRAYIDQHLGEELNVTTLCRALGISRSKVYRAFGEQGGVLRHIQLRRLKRMEKLLSDPSETRSIAALAQASGFPDKSHFSRVFKTMFGVTPRTFRSAAIMPAAPAAPQSASNQTAPETYQSWLRGLN